MLYHKTFKVERVQNPFKKWKATKTLEKLYAALLQSYPEHPSYLKLGWVG